LGRRRSQRPSRESGRLFICAWTPSSSLFVSRGAARKTARTITEKQFVSIRYSDQNAFQIFNRVTSRLQQRRFRNPNDAFAELLEAIVGHIASNLRSVEQELHTLSVEIFAEQRAHRKHKKRLGLKRVVQRLGKRNSMIANLRESSLSLASLVSYFIGHVGRFAEFRPRRWQQTTSQSGKKTMIEIFLQT
jgi:Mg2+ and Co2+ transporter CorA